MALVYSKQLLSGSSLGRPIDIATVDSPGTVLHGVEATATTAREEVHLYIWNNSTATAPVTFELGATGDTDRVLLHIPSQNGPNLFAPGFVFTATQSIVRAFTTGTATSQIRVTGWVNRAT